MSATSEVFDRAREAADFLRENLGDLPPVAVVLGSGWDALVEGEPPTGALRFEDIPGFSLPGTGGHGGRVFINGTVGGPLLVQDGRLHRYEGLGALEAAFPVFALAEAGVRLLVLLSAAGGLNRSSEYGIPCHLFRFALHRGLPSRKRRSDVPSTRVYPLRRTDGEQGSGCRTGFRKHSYSR